MKPAPITTRRAPGRSASRSRRASARLRSSWTLEKRSVPGSRRGRASGGDQQLRERQSRAGGERQLACGDVQAGCSLAEQQLDVAVAVPVVGAEAQRGFVDPSREVLLGQRRAVVGRDGLVADELDGAVMAVAAKRLDSALGREAAAGDHDARTAEVMLVIGHGASIGGPVEPPVSAESEALLPTPLDGKSALSGALPAPRTRGPGSTTSATPADAAVAQGALYAFPFSPDHRPRRPRRERRSTRIELEGLNDAVADAHVMVVAPAGPVAGERWIVDLTARRVRAEERLNDWATMLTRQVRELELEVGDENPRLALADARRAFRPDACDRARAARRALGPVRLAAVSPARSVQARRQTRMLPAAA